jgi:exopolyphosphatase/guanosine-5'-triphosphate,3'-diphosphate pyrophosphatase
VSEGDFEAVAELLGRAPQGAFEVVVRDSAGRPVVILNAPFLNDGTPMPTRYWLVGRLERESVSRLESTGGVKAAESAVPADGLAAAHARYTALRDASLPPGHPGPKPTGGVGGTRRGVKCLHAHLAWYLAGGPDPVGQWTADRLGIDRRQYSVTPSDGQSGDVDHERGPVAAIDCGTNSTRLLVVDAEGHPLERLMRITHLGAGIDKEERLAPDAVQRTIEVLTEFREVLDRCGVTGVRATTTSAGRDAANGGELVRRATEVLGVTPEVLTGEEEGRLAFLGATAELDPAQGPYLVIDVGGGSTELVGGASLALCVVSLEVGCVRATERFFVSDPPAESDLGKARAYVRQLVAGALDAQPELGGAAQLVGVAGTVAALVSLDQGLVSYDRSRIHHARLTRATVERLLGELATLSVARRRECPALEPERADVIVGGAAVLVEAMAVLGFETLIASESDLLDGIVAELLAG